MPPQVSHERHGSMTPQEYSAATGNGVVPGPWIVMPFLTVFGLIGRATDRAGRAGRYLIAFTVTLAVLSVAAMWVMLAGSTT